MDKKITLIVGYTTITMLLPCTSIPLTLHLGHGLRPFPVFIECVLVDCNGKKHYFHDKLPVFSLDCNTEVPRVGKMRCRIIQEKQALNKSMLILKVTKARNWNFAQHHDLPLGGGFLRCETFSLAILSKKMGAFNG